MSCHLFQEIHQSKTAKKVSRWIAFRTQSPLYGSVLAGINPDGCRGRRA